MKYFLNIFFLILIAVLFETMLFITVSEGHFNFPLLSPDCKIDLFT